MHISEAKIDHMKKNFDSVQLLLIKMAHALKIFSLYDSQMEKKILLEQPK